MIPKSGNRFSEKIMLHQVLGRDDLEKTHPALPRRLRRGLLAAGLRLATQGIVKVAAAVAPGKGKRKQQQAGLEDCLHTPPHHEAP
jgi:hypothetical protein